MDTKCRIMVCGRTGVGKTSLIQAVTHPGTVPDSAIGDAVATTRGFDVYETEIADFIDCEGMEPGQTVDEYARFIAEGMSGPVHNIWYCIDASGGRVQNADAELIRRFSDRVLLVVTKSELLRREQMEELMSQLPDLLPVERIAVVSGHEHSGLDQLLDKAVAVSERTMESEEQEHAGFRSDWDEYYGNMRRRWAKQASDQADEFIVWAAGRAAAIAAIPLPFADVVPLIANEAYMIYRLGAVYGCAVDKSMMTMLAGTAGGSIAGKLAASLLPLLKIPIAAGVTYGVGKAAKAYFESGMTLDADELKALYAAGERESRNTDWRKHTTKED